MEMRSLSARNVETARATAGWITGLEENERPGSLLWCEVGKCNSARLLLDAATSIEGEGTSVSLIDLDLHNGGLSALVNSPGGGPLQAVLRGEQAPLEAADLVMHVDAYWWPVAWFLGLFIGAVANRIEYGTWGAA